ncbi:DUF6765 family protein [Sulfurospirillum arsenophilum]|uniref:DUF6765 family protein n=1 Tax=Sulfurospirillum arsenophilum TaxID=56698 RepID=UPI0005A5D93D|nr:DUF6765 family protein [Sulfurospirillum arsenophilum]
MQIDCHHGMTYVLARMAGFKHEEAEVIAYAAQYVDDATNSGLIKFENGAMYSRICSAHGVYDLSEHMNEYENHLVWVPFHFLPGNEGKMENENPDTSFIDKLVCKPDSYVAKEMVSYCVKNSDKDYSLHRLGITMHVYADTYAHQGFVGMIHDMNKIEDLEMENEDMGLFNKANSATLSATFPMGHGPALQCPDKPYLRWSYVNGLGERIKRDNLDDFMMAAKAMFGELVRYRFDSGMGELSDELTENAEFNFARIKRNLESFTEPDENERHARWLASIAKGDFSFEAQDLTYIAKGKDSWKHKATGQLEEKDDHNEKFPYSKEFLKSDWKLFHDAIQEHRLTVLHDILPKYGICVA